MNIIKLTITLIALNIWTHYFHCEILRNISTTVVQKQ